MPSAKGIKRTLLCNHTVLQRCSTHCCWLISRRTRVGATGVGVGVLSSIAADPTWHVAKHCSSTESLELVRYTIEAATQAQRLV